MDLLKCQIFAVATCTAAGRPITATRDTSSGATLLGAHNLTNKWPLFKLYPHHRLCDSSGEWTGSAPQCRLISCGDPPMLPHSAVTLLNGSTVWRAQATYSCLPGHGECRPSGHHHKSVPRFADWRILTETRNTEEIKFMQHTTGHLAIGPEFYLV